MVFTHAVDLLREHVPDSTRIHYVITSGGDAPNVVPAFAEVFLYLRSPSMNTLDEVWPRILKCGEAGALATETKFALEIVNSSYTILPNDSLAKLHRQEPARRGRCELHRRGDGLCGGAAQVSARPRASHRWIAQRPSSRQRTASAMAPRMSGT